MGEWVGELRKGEGECGTLGQFAICRRRDGEWEEKVREEREIFFCVFFLF